MKPPIVPDDFDLKEFAEHFGPMPRCKHGMLICVLCNPELNEREPR